jgi:hypothetical protein
MATCNAQEQPQGFACILTFLFKLMMAYQAEMCLINSGISNWI